MYWIKNETDQYGLMEENTMKKTCIIALGLMMILCSNLCAKETLTWQVVHWPPFQMLEGPDKGHGMFDRLLELYTSNLPQYEHKTITMNWARFWSDVKEEKKICNMFAIKTEERTKYALFSKPLSIGLPLRIIMRTSSIETLGSRNPVSIVDILKDNRFNGVFIDKRSYYAVMDEILEKYASLTTVKRLAIPEESVLQMVLAGRADYTLEYPYLANYIVGKFQTRDGDAAGIGSIPIKEIQEYAQSSLACPKNDWGKKVIQDFNEMLDRVKHKPEYLKILQMLYTDPKELEALRQGFEKIILNAE